MSNARRVPWAHSPRSFLFAAGVGVIGGLIGTSFQLLRGGIQGLVIGEGSLIEAAENLVWYERLLVPFLGASAASLLLYWLMRKTPRQGLADVMEAVSLKQARKLSVRRTFAPALSSLLIISTGGSLGREGPIAYLSASLGARFARLGGMPGTRVGLFAGCGIAAGMSSAYYAPFGAAIFAMEVVLGNFSMEILAPVVVSSVVSALVVTGLAAPSLLGQFGVTAGPLFDFGNLGFVHNHAAEYVIYILLGIAAAGAGWLFLKILREVEGLFNRSRIPLLLRLPLGGLMIGAIGIGLPHVWGNGYSAINLLFEPTFQLVLSFVALLFIMKMIATAITLGSGGKGGVFTPTLFVGAALGLMVGAAAHWLLPQIVAEPKHYSIVGMAAVLAATTNAPITAIFLLFEMTRATEMILPTMVAAITASVAARAIGVESIYAYALKKRGTYIPEGIEETTLTTTRVIDIMRRDAVWTQETATFDMIVGMVQKTRTNSIYVVDKHSALTGVIRLHDIKNYLADADLGPAVIAADLSVHLEPAHPRQTLAEILERFDEPEMNEMPVVDDDKQLVGIVDRRDLISALSVEVLHKGGLRAKFVEHAGAQHYVQMPRDHGVSKIPVPEEYVGKSCKEADIRKRTGLTVLTIVRTEDGAETRLLPEPETVLQPDDALVVMGPIEAIEELGGEV